MSVFVFFCCPSFSHCFKNGLTFRIYLYWLIKCRKYTHAVSTIMALFQLIASIDCYFIQMPFAGLYFFRVQSHMRETRESCEQICVFFSHDVWHCWTFMQIFPRQAMATPPESLACSTVPLRKISCKTSCPICVPSCPESTYTGVLFHSRKSTGVIDNT